MSFDITKHHHNTVALKNAEFDLSVWISDGRFGLDREVGAALAIETGQARLLILDVNREKAEEMISAMHAHVEKIKQAEIELLAIQTKAAA